MGADDTGEHLQLDDGRMLGIAQFGVPDGTPVFYFHGHPGSRREWPTFDHGDAATELGVRIIAIDRPGHGLSDFQPGRTILDWPADVVAVADALDLDRFAVLGISGGGPYAAACAYRIGERLSATAIVCGMGPPDAPGVTDGTAWKFAAGRPALLRRMLLMFMRFGLRQPERFVAQVGDSLAGPDKALLAQRPELAAQIIERSFAEAFRSGIAGINHEARLYARPWGFDLGDIGGEVHLWHGTDDENVPVSVGHHVADAIEGCHARFVAGEAHLSLACHLLPEVLGALTSAVETPGSTHSR